MSGVTADSEKPSGTCHMWCRPRAGPPNACCGFCVKSSRGNDKYVLTGKAAHVPSDEKPVPQFHSFRVEYRVLDGRLSEISRVRIPVH